MTEESKRHPATAPAHSRQRREHLPWERPKPASEDVDAPAMVERILRSESYRRPDEDVDFLHSDATRAIRLQIDYLKPQLRLEQTGIKNTCRP